MKEGKFIAIEGLEGAGKSTAIAAIQNYLKMRNIESIVTREPGGTVIGESLRDIIKNKRYKNILNDKTELLLFYASRIQLLEEVIKPALAKGIWVLADRFELSTFAYQGAGRGLDENFIKTLSQFSLNAFKPDLTFYLDLSPEEGMARVIQRGALDRIEEEQLDFFHRIREYYLNALKEEKNIHLIDARQDPVSVARDIENYL